MIPERATYWAGQLRPLHLDTGPIEDQFRRRTRILLVVSALVTGILLYLATIFAAFGRWDLGFGIAAIVGLPVLGLAWAGHRRLHARVLDYQVEIEQTAAR